MNTLLIVYLLLINIAAFALFGADKRKARRGDWRISEKALFLSAVLGGSLGALIGMRLGCQVYAKAPLTIELPDTAKTPGEPVLL